MIAAALAAAELLVSAPARAVQDGRSVAAVEIASGPEPLEGEDRQLPDRGSIACTGAAVIAAGPIAPPRLLPPAASTAGELSCIARRRGAESAFSLHLDPPGPGLYARLAPAEAGRLALEAFRIQPGGDRQAPRSLRLASSAGTAEAGRLLLPPGRAPRAIAVALLDAEGEGAAFLPLPGSTRLRLESKRRSLLSVRVAGATFGPVRAPEGKATLPVLVPPGVRLGVVRAVDRLGNARELAIDLETPELPRIAAVASGAQAVAAGELRVAIALAAPDGAPARDAPVRASAARGSVQPPAPRGPGLWLASYRAPAAPGSDRITVQVEGDAGAGRVELSVEVVPGPPSQISLEPPARPVHAGEEVAVRAGVRDAAGNPLSGVPLEASLAGTPARVSWDGAAVSIRGAVPQLLPEGGVQLSVRSGEQARADARIEALPGEASSAELAADPDGREALLRAVVRDRFGNALGASGFDLAAQGAQVSDIRASASGAAEASLVAAPRSRAAEASVVSGGRVLAHTKVAFDPPPEAWLLFARAEGADVSNGGALQAPRLGAAAGIRRRFGPVEGAGLLGLDALWYRDQITAEVAGAARPVSRHLFALGIPLLARARLPFLRKWGAGLEAGPVPVLAWTSAASDASGTEKLVSLRLGFRARAAVDYALGRGRIELGASWGTVRLLSGPLRGEIEGHSFFLGYEAWWLDVGP